MNCWIWILLLLCCNGNKGACGCSSTHGMESHGINRMSAPEPPERMMPPRPPRPPYEDCGCE